MLYLPGLLQTPEPANPLMLQPTNFAGHILASVDINYDISPIVVTVNDRPPSFLHFLVRLCAVIGGVFAVTGKI